MAKKAGGNRLGLYEQAASRNAMRTKQKSMRKPKA